jgi:hypothetical protein
MVIDTSALLAILCDEPDAPLFEAAIESDATRLISAATLLETAIVIDARFGEEGGRELDLLIHKAQIEIPFRSGTGRNRPRGLPHLRERAAFCRSQLRRLFPKRAQHRSWRTTPLERNGFIEGRRARQDLTAN